MKVYTKKDLLQALKDAGLPSSYKSLLSLERQGVIPRGGEITGVSNDRFYTEQDIATIVEKVRSIKQK